MKSIKSKLFFGFSVMLLVILTLLSFISLGVLTLQQNEDNKNKIIQLEQKVNDFISSNKKSEIRQLDKYIDIEQEFVIVLKEKKVVFSNETNKKTNRIIEEVSEEKHNLQEYFQEDEFLVFYNKKNGYDIYVGIDDDIVSEYILDLILIIVILNTIIFVLLLIIGYILINKTIKPLKAVLNQLKTLRNGKNLSKRLDYIDTNDEFEELITSLNEMMDNIENSVENIKQFSSDASHELRTPLTVIQGEVELCKNLNMSKEELVTSIKKIDIEQKKLQEIIKDFLLLARLDKEVLKSIQCSLDKVVFEAIERNIEKVEEKHLELILDIDDGIYIEFDEKYLFIVINNLLTNAIKYTQSGYIKLIAKSENESVYFKIQDSGIGISKSDLDKLFNRFFRVDKTRSNFENGIGLGLSIVKKICDNYNTKIELKSELNKGSEFKLIF